MEITEWRRESFHISKELKIKWNQTNQKVLLLYIAHKGSDLLWESSVCLASANDICLREKRRFERSGNVSGQFSLVQSLSRVQHFSTSWTAARQAFLSITKSNSCPWSLMPSNHLIVCHPLLLLHSVFPSIKVFSNESALRIRWPKYWSFSFSISHSNEFSGLINVQFSSVQSLSHVWLFVTLWTVAYQVSLSMGSSRQEYQSGLPFPSPGDHPDPGIKPRSPAL